MAVNKNLNIIEDDSQLIEITVNQDGLPFDFSDYATTFQMRNQSNELIVEKSSSSGITITDNVILLSLNFHDTNQAGVYNYELQTTNESEKKRFTLVNGIITISKQINYK